MTVNNCKPTRLQTFVVHTWNYGSLSIITNFTTNKQNGTFQNNYQKSKDHSRDNCNPEDCKGFRISGMKSSNPPKDFLKNRVL